MRLAQPPQQQLQRLLAVEPGQHPAQLPHGRQLLVAHQQLLAPGAGLDGVDRREDPLVREVAAQPDLHVAGALELLEDHLVHRRAALDEGRREDRQRAAVLDVAGGAEEPLGRVERRRVDAAGQDPAARRGREVVRPAQPGDAVEQHDDVVAELHQPLRPLDGQLGDDRVVAGGPVEGRADDLALDRALEVGDLLGPLVDEDDHQVALGVVRGDRVARSPAGPSSCRPWPGRRSARAGPCRWVRRCR